MKFIYGVTATLVALFSCFFCYFVSLYIHSELELTNFCIAEVSKYFIKNLIPQNNSKEILLNRKFIKSLSDSNPHGKLTNFTIIDIPRETDNFQSNLTIRVIFPTPIFDTNQFNEPKLLPVIFWLHSGGFVFNYGSNVDSNLLSKLTGFIIVDVDYRLAPEYIYPSALEDSAIALKWIKSNIHLFSGDPNTIIIGGSSAGGNLAAALTALVIDKKKISISNIFNTPKAFKGLKSVKIKGLILSSPMLQYDTIFPSWLTYRNANGILSLDQTLWYWSLYIGDLVSRKSSLCSKDYKLCPLHTPDKLLKRFPRTVIILGKHDVLLDEGIAFYEKLNRLSPKGAQLRVYNDSIHSFWPCGTQSTVSFKNASDIVQTEILSMVDFQYDEMIMKKRQLLLS